MLFTFQYFLNCYITVMQISICSQCSDQRLTSTGSPFTSISIVGYRPDRICKDMGRRPKNCKDTLDSAESFGHSRCSPSITCTDTRCKDTRCKDTRCKDTSHWLIGPLLTGRTQKQNRTHRAKSSLLALWCFALLFPALCCPPLPATPTNFSQRCLFGNRNPCCPHCSCFLGEWQFFNVPKLFRSRPYYLPNGMLVYRIKFCCAHTSVWYFRRGKRKYASFTGAEQFSIHKQLELAGAPIGLPGDRGSYFKYFASYQLNTPTPIRSSGHGSCCAAKGHKHQYLRSQESMAQRRESFNERRRESRLQYRKYLSSTLNWREFTFPRPVGPLFKVQDSQRTQKRHYPSHTLKPTLRSRASFYKNYVACDHLDEPTATLDSFSLPKRSSFYILGTSKHSLALENMNNSNHLSNPCHWVATAFRKPRVKILTFFAIHIFTTIFLALNRTRARALALPFPHLFFRLSMTFTRGIHALQSLFSTLVHTNLPCSQSMPLANTDPTQDQLRKEHFWQQLHRLFSQYSSQYIPVLMGDFNARLSPNFTQSLPDLFGPAIFAPDLDEDLYPSANLFHLTDFQSSNELSVVSTMRSRPPSLLVTYQDIVANPPPPSAPTFPMQSSTTSFVVKSIAAFFAPSALIPPFLFLGTIVIFLSLLLFASLPFAPLAVLLPHLNWISPFLHPNSNSNPHFLRNLTSQLLLLPTFHLTFALMVPAQTNILYPFPTLQDGEYILPPSISTFSAQ